MKTRFFTFIFIICICTTHIAVAQNEENKKVDTSFREIGTKNISASLDFTSNKRLYHIKHLPFNKVVVFDNRFDTTKYKITKYQTFTIGTFDRPASEAIKNYIEKKISNYPRKSQTVYISLQQFRFSNIAPTTLFFSANAYIAVGDGYKKITSVRLKIPFDLSDRKTITNALNRFIETINSDYYKHSQDNTIYTIADINVNVTDNWAQYPIERDSQTVNGIYSSFNNFRNNKIIPTDLSLKMTSDSFYVIEFKDSSRFPTKRRKAIDNIWAVSYNGEFYIAVLHKYFLPLHKINNRFYFYAPHSLPNMYTIAAGAKYPGGSSSGSGFTTTSGKEDLVILAVVVTVIVVAITIREIENGEERKEEHKYRPVKTATKSINEDALRNSFIDMDSGDIIYY